MENEVRGIDIRYEKFCKNEMCINNIKFLKWWKIWKIMKRVNICIIGVFENRKKWINKKYKNKKKKIVIKIWVFKLKDYIIF